MKMILKKPLFTLLHSKAFILITALFALFLITQFNIVWAAAREETLLPDSEYATPYYIIESGKSGPVVMVTAGVHGDERAPVQAAEQIREWSIKQGILIVVPRCNIQAVNKGKRLGAGVDLNRSFASSTTQKSDSPIATALLKLIRTQKVDWLIDLHEGVDYSSSSSSVGQSIIFMPGNKGSEKFAEQLAETLNKDIKKKGFQFNLLKYPVKDSLARSAADLYDVRSLIFETCRQESLADRISLQKQSVQELLKFLDVK